MSYPKSVSSLLLLLCFSLAACSLPTSDNNNTTEITGVPVVTLASPLPNASYAEGVSVIVQASVSNAGADINRVEISVDNVIIATKTDPNPTGALTFSVTQAWSAEAAGQHSISVTAFRADGSASTPATVTVNVVDPATLSGGGDEESSSGSDATTESGTSQQSSGGGSNTNPTATIAPTNTPRPTDPPAATAIPASATPNVPTARFTTGINVRSGPGTNFEPPIGNFAANDTSEILALNTNGTWYRVRFRGTDGWVFAQLAEVTGDLSGLPREVGPATPVPPPPTTPPLPTAAPTSATAVNLAFANQSVSSAVPPTCGQQFTITVTVTNNGTTQSGDGRILVEDVYTATGEVRATYDGGLLPAGGLAPGQTHTIVAPLTVSANYDEAHFIRIKIDPNNQVNETNETDNEQQLPYTLQRGSC